MQREYIERKSVKLPNGCWQWAGHIDRRGYGRISRSLAHRVAYQLFIGPIPGDLTVDHLCFNPACVNPAHLRLLTHLENSRLQRSALKTHCINGHEFNEANTYRRTRGGGRSCRPCHNAAARRHVARKAAAAREMAVAS